jgi:hypothetical protein
LDHDKPRKPANHRPNIVNSNPSPRLAPVIKALGIAFSIA